MPKHSLILLVIIALLLAACQGQVQTSPQTAVPTALSQPTATIAAVIPSATSAAEQVASGAPAGCTVISPRTTPDPTQQSVFPPATDKDWSTGPKDAAITLTEYSDFQ
jgi:hypothetical protein